jgi:hypothetical protein
MKKIIFLMLVCLVVSSISVMAACEKQEAEISGGELLAASAYVDGDSDTNYFGFTDYDGNGVYDPEYENYDTCVLSGSAYLEEYYCDGENAHFETVECEFGCETVYVGNVPFGKCAVEPGPELEETIDGGSVSETEETVEVELKEFPNGEGEGMKGKNVEDLEVLSEGFEVDLTEPTLIERAPIVLAECISKDEIHEAKKEIKDKFFEYVKARKLISMQTGIDYYNGMGIDITDLVAYKDQIEGITDWAEMKDIVTQFRERAHAINAENDIIDETLEELIQLLKDARNNDPTLVAMHDEIEELALEHRLVVFDAKVCVANNAITKLSYHGDDVTDLEADLEAIENLRDDFKNAIETAQAVCYRGIDICVTEEAEAYKELKEEIEQSFRSLREAITAML